MHAADKHKACSREQELLDQADEGLLSVAGSKLTEHEDSHDRDREHEVNCDELKENTPSMANSKPLVPEESVAVKRVTCRKVSKVCLSNTCVFICCFFIYRKRACDRTQQKPKKKPQREDKFVIEISSPPPRDMGCLVPHASLSSARDGSGVVPRAASPACDSSDLFPDISSSLARIGSDLVPDVPICNHSEFHSSLETDEEIVHTQENSKVLVVSVEGVEDKKVICCFCKHNHMYTCICDYVLHVTTIPLISV